MKQQWRWRWILSTLYWGFGLTSGASSWLLVIWWWELFPPWSLISICFIRLHGVVSLAHQSARFVDKHLWRNLTVTQSASTGNGFPKCDRTIAIELQEGATVVSRNPLAYFTSTEMNRVWLHRWPGTVLKAGKISCSLSDTGIRIFPCPVFS
jgi:hypothetical protein